MGISQAVSTMQDMTLTPSSSGALLSKAFNLPPTVGRIIPGLLCLKYLPQCDMFTQVTTVYEVIQRARQLLWSGS